MRRSSVAAKNPHSSITLTVPQSSSGRDAEMRSSSAASSQENGTEAASTVYGAPASGWDAAADYKDTVLFLAQQQSMHHREMMDMLKHVVASLPHGISGGGSAAYVGSPTAPMQQGSAPATPPPTHDDYGGQQAFVSSHDHQMQKVLEYGREVTDPSQVRDIKLQHLGGYTGSQATWFQSVSGVDVELHAAKGRIAQLESANRLLHKQLEQKEDTIKRLTQTNISALSSRIATTQSHTPQRSTASLQQPLSEQKGASPWSHHDATPHRYLQPNAAVSPSLSEVLYKHQQRQ